MSRERVIVRDGRKDVAAIVPLEDLEMLQMLEIIEDARDAAEARRRLADRKDKAIPYREARRSLGLTK